VVRGAPLPAPGRSHDIGRPAPFCLVAP
jgi:hypothetical protein